MSKLYYRHGVVGSSKTMSLLAVAHNYKQQDKKVILIKPKLDIRNGENITSRSGLSAKANILLDSNTDLDSLIDKDSANCILVDEAQFVSEKHIRELRNIATFKDIPVICYGLRTDYQGNLFEGAKALFALADTIEEIKNTCWFCDKKAIMNIKYVNGKATDGGKGEIELGYEDKYLPSCYSHYFVLFEKKHGKNPS